VELRPRQMEGAVKLQNGVWFLSLKGHPKEIAPLGVKGEVRGGAVLTQQGQLSVVETVSPLRRMGPLWPQLQVVVQHCCFPHGRHHTLQGVGVEE